MSPGGRSAAIPGSTRWISTPCSPGIPKSCSSTSSRTLLAVHVLRGDGLAGAPVGAIRRLRRLAEDVGASFHTVVGGEDVPAALLEFARGANATQLVLGTSRRSRLARMFAHGVGTRVVQESGTIDVHMVTHDEAGRGLRLPALHTSLSLARRGLGWALAVALPLAATGLGIGLRPLLGLSTDVVAYFLATVVVALVGGLGPFAGLGRLAGMRRGG